MTSKILPCTILVFCGQFIDVLGLDLRITPRTLRVNKDELSWATVLCSSDVPLGACQLSWWANKEPPGPVLDLSAGARSQANRSHLISGLLNYEYSGQGLEKGDCGVRMQIQGKKVWTVGCRVRGLTGGWKYEWMELVAYATDLLPNVVMEPSRVAVVFPGQDLNVMCSSKEPVDTCYFSVPGVPGWLDFARGLLSKDSKGRHLSRGKGPASGHCGLSLHGVGEEDNGPTRCYLWKHPKFADNRVVNVVVAKAPTTPTMDVRYDGAILKATCSASGSRPVVGIRWSLDDDVIRNDDDDDAFSTNDDAWAWPWFKFNITQNLTRSLEAADYGKVLKCAVSHVTLEKPVELSFLISRSSGDESLPVLSTRAKSSRLSTPSNTCEMGLGGGCPQQAEYCELRLIEAKHAAAAAALAEESAKVTLEAARLAVRAEEARGRAEEARALEEKSWAQNAVEELDYDQARRNLTLRELRGKAR